MEKRVYEEKQISLERVGSTSYLTKLLNGTLATYHVNAGQENIANNCSINLWDPKTGQCIGTVALGEDSDHLNLIGVLSDNTLISGNTKGIIKRWDPKTQKCIQTITLPLNAEDYLHSFIVLPDDTIACICHEFKDKTEAPGDSRWRKEIIITLSYQHVLKVMSLETGLCTRVINLNLKSDVRNTMDIWRMKMLHYPNRNDADCSSMIVLQNGNLAYGDRRTGQIYIWNPQTGERIYTLNNQALPTPEGRRMVFTLLSNGNLISGITSYDNDPGLISEWDPKTGQLVSNVSVSQFATHYLTTLSNGTIASRSADKLQIWDPPTGQCLQTLVKRHCGGEQYVVALSEGTIATCASCDLFITFWTPNATNKKEHNVSVVKTFQERLDDIKYDGDEFEEQGLIDLESGDVIVDPVLGDDDTLYERKIAERMITNKTNGSHQKPLSSYKAEPRARLTIQLLVEKFEKEYTEIIAKEMPAVSVAPNPTINPNTPKPLPSAFFVNQPAQPSSSAPILEPLKSVSSLSHYPSHRAAVQPSAFFEPLTLPEPSIKLPIRLAEGLAQGEFQVKLTDKGLSLTYISKVKLINKKEFTQEVSQIFDELKQALKKSGIANYIINLTGNDLIIQTQYDDDVDDLKVFLKEIDFIKEINSRLGHLGELSVEHDEHAGSVLKASYIKKASLMTEMEFNEKATEIFFELQQYFKESGKSDLIIGYPNSNEKNTLLVQTQYADDDTKELLELLIDSGLLKDVPNNKQLLNFMPNIVSLLSSHTSYQPKISLNEFLSANGFQLRTTEGDGNCFFSSVAILLNHQNGTSLTHADIRREAINYIKTHSERFGGIFGEGLDYGTQEEYL